jgi:uncharacterized protein (TIGR02996 family)
MSDKEALIRAICTFPDEDTPRLVYADWLEEHNEGGRAEFVRGQVLNGGTMDRLLGGWKYHGAPPVNTVWCDRDSLHLFPSEVVVTVARGFVSHISLPCAAFLEHAQAIFAAHPVTEVTLTDKRPDHEIGRYRIWWYDDSNGNYPNAPDYLPMELFHALPGTIKNSGKHFSSEESAMDWLSVRCVAFARKLVNLPPLLQPSEAS